MTISSSAFNIDDGKAFDENFEVFAQELQALDPTLGPVLRAHLLHLVDGTSTNAVVWAALLAAAEENAA